MLLGYVRVSTDDQAKSDRTSLEEQERVIRGVAMTRGVDKLDITIYSDPGVSGSIPLKHRPDGAKLFADMKPGDVVVAAKLDRMFRSAVNALATAETMKARGIGLILPELGIEPVTDNGSGKLFFGMLSLVADFERDVINERMRNGKRAKKERGGHTGGEARFGWKIIGHGREARLEPDEQEQQVIELATKWWKRRRPAEVVQALTKQGFKARSGKPFQIIQVQRMVEQARAS